MKKTLNEEISRIKNMMGRITNESFDEFDDDFIDSDDEIGDEEIPLDYDSDEDENDPYISRYDDDFSPKLKQKAISDKIKYNVNREQGSNSYMINDPLHNANMKQYYRDLRDKGYYGAELPLPPKETREPLKPYSPIQPTDIPLEKYLALKRDAMFRGDNKIKYK